MDPMQAYEYYKEPENQEPAGPAQRREGRRLSSMMPVRFSREMIDAVKLFADQDGITVSAWIRRLVGREILRRRPPVTTVASDGLSVTFHGASRWLDAPESTNTGQPERPAAELVLQV